jgi:hypothetical protein
MISKSTEAGSSIPRILSSIMRAVIPSRPSVIAP